MRKQTILRLLLQANKQFPIDCEMLDTQQQNTALVQALGNAVGDRAILYGCAPEKNGAARAEGYVFLRTKDFPEGEVVYWEGGSIAGGMYLHQQTSAVSAQGFDFPQAYTERSLRPGVGSENYSWADFRQYKTVAQLEAGVAALTETLAKLAPPPLGIVEMWAGAKVPDGYALCEGQQLKITDYPELYAALGTAFNKAPNYAGTPPQSTTSGYFRLPDLRGRFIVGSSTVDADYGAYGKAGGEKRHTLVSDEMPSHSHSVDDYYYLEASAGKTVSGSVRLPDKYTGMAMAPDMDNDYMSYATHDSKSVGKGAPHENRPPYYVLAYIMKTKN